MATQPTAGLTYDDLQASPEDNFRRELIDGELIVTAAPPPIGPDTGRAIRFPKHPNGVPHRSKADSI